MTIEEFFSEMESLLEIEKGTIQPDLKLADTPGWSSMATLDVLAMADEHFGKQIRPAQVTQCGTWKELFALLSGPNA